MFNSRNFICLWICVLIFSVSVFSQNRPSVIKNLTERADVIVIGKVIQKESSWNNSKTRIYTKTTVQVEEFLKGNNKENTVEIIYPGGEVGDTGELYTHMPKFENNEEVLVFLKMDEKNNDYKVLNGEAGKIKLFEDEKTKEKVTGSNIRINLLKLQIESFLTEH